MREATQAHFSKSIHTPTHTHSHTNMQRPIMYYGTETGKHNNIVRGIIVSWNAGKEKVAVSLAFRSPPNSGQDVGEQRMNVGHHKTKQGLGKRNIK